MTPRKLSPKMKFPIIQFDNDISLTVGNILVEQFAANSNIVTTGHELQGISNDVLIVNSWNCSFSKWIYVVLSRACTLSGLYLCIPLDLNKPFRVPEKLIEFETRMKSREEAFLKKRLQDI